MKAVWETERMTLRQLTDGDAAALYEIDRDPEVMRFLTGGMPTSYDEINATLARVIADHDRFPDLGRWAALDKDTQEFIGWFALDVPEGGGGGDADLGYRLGRRWWGNGLATEGAKALIHKAFVDACVDRVFARTMAVNTASRRVMEKAGLRLVRTFHLQWDDPIDGTEYGEVEYELLRTDYLA
jgi:RimJ/RimL family protein N-acetyltransferase